MNRIIVVTGGAGGIGRCIVAHFASQGDSVYFIDQNQQATLTQVEKMRERGWQVTGFVGDVAEKQALEEFAALVLREHPEGIHCLINNACLMRGGILSDCEYEDFLYVQRVGVVAPYMLARLFKDHFQGMGAIVNISSTRAFQSQPADKPAKTYRHRTLLRDKGNARYFQDRLLSLPLPEHILYALKIFLLHPASPLYLSFLRLSPWEVPPYLSI